MGRAMCGHGGGDADHFARAVSLHNLDEPSAREMVIGSVPDVVGPGIVDLAQPTPSF